MPQGPAEIDEAVVQARTGKSSDEWYSLLDRWGARAKDRTLAAKYLRDEYGLSRWWAQCIMVRYELSRGLR